ncbi:hypothetical protein GCM10007103_00010 [Salinimicrobium marinum]|uniref:Outer membrane protein beta-barrel domain-containing protein n=1 Tax=Salinimicrobium marinum TaxID=680283 RepID=A0A918VTM0_9FLAO|nr:hypothetical protein [Salinimicrobium marinum]GHA22952.1 hypothetical protein GCM10007103_00010 [Salinimicrobium marinum]
MSGYTIYIPNERSSYNNDGELVSKSASEWIFEKDVVGLIGGAGIKKFLSNNFSVTANLRYEFDLTNADAYPLLRKDLNDEPNWEAKKTHHYRIGLEFGIQYHFDKKQKVYVEGIL